ncbi:class I SAM-dependent methyltransferase [Bradyrhizobium sp. CCGUVB23]|uniref:class I SAM-dependent methyltransferase n=1 Tax=Bradyrhizobium sp. CCGUVB23 TaxID=2949630 RepID=UPI003531B1AA
MSRLGKLDHGRLLEIAAGTGVVTRALARTLPLSVEIVATDLNQPMLDLAASRLTGRPVEWRQADANSLPFDADVFDAVLCQFGVMFFPDKARAFREAFRVLKPGGRLLFNVWTDIMENEFTHVVTEAVAGFFPDDPPRFFAQVPHGYHDSSEIREALNAAGFERIDMERVKRHSRAESARAAAIGLCQGTPLRNQIEERDPGRLDEATEAAAAALSKRFDDSRIEGQMCALVVEAWRPIGTLAANFDRA